LGGSKCVMTDTRVRGVDLGHLYGERAVARVTPAEGGKGGKKKVRKRIDYRRTLIQSFQDGKRGQLGKCLQIRRSRLNEASENLNQKHKGQRARCKVEK